MEIREEIEKLIRDLPYRSICRESKCGDDGALAEVLSILDKWECVYEDHPIFVLGNEEGLLCLNEAFGPEDHIIILRRKEDE